MSLTSAIRTTRTNSSDKIWTQLASRNMRGKPLRRSTGQEPRKPYHEDPAASCSSHAVHMWMSPCLLGMKVDKWTTCDDFALDHFMEYFHKHRDGQVIFRFCGQRFQGSQLMYWADSDDGGDHETKKPARGWFGGWWANPDAKIPIFWGSKILRPPQAALRSWPCVPPNTATPRPPTSSMQHTPKSAAPICSPTIRSLSTVSCPVAAHPD